MRTFFLAGLLWACLLAGCTQASASPTAVEPTSTYRMVTESPIPKNTATSTQNPSSTAPPTDTPEPASTPKHLPGLVKLSCPELSPPLGVFHVPEPYIVKQGDTETVYVLYEIAELVQETSPEPCMLFLEPPPMGKPKLAGDTIFWQSFDYDDENVTIWQLDRNGSQRDEVLPKSIPQEFARVESSIGTSGLVEFLPSEDGEYLIWAWTEPELMNDGQYAYVQTILLGTTGQGFFAELLAAVEIDPVGRPHILRLHQYLSDQNLLYYSDEPVGLGRQWPEPRGRYTSLYAVSSGLVWDPRLLFDCEQDYWCISDFSTDHDLLTAVQGDSVAVYRLGSGEKLVEVNVGENFSTLRQAIISPDGQLAFLAVVQDLSAADIVVENVTLFVLDPPYTQEPQAVFHHPGLRNLVSWISNQEILADGVPDFEGAAQVHKAPSSLIRINTIEKTGSWLPHDARGLEILIP